MLWNDNPKGGHFKNDALFEKRFAKMGNEDIDFRREWRTADTNDLIHEGIARPIGA